MSCPIDSPFFLWFSYGLPIDSQFSYGFPMVYPLIHHFPMLFLWFTQRLPGSRKRVPANGSPKDRIARDGGLVADITAEVGGLLQHLLLATKRPIRIPVTKHHMGKP